MALIPTNYRPNTIRGIIIALMSEFRSLQVEIIKPGTTDIIKTIDVPLTFGPMEKYHQIAARLNDTDYDNYYQQLPKMSLNWTSINYDGERASGVNDTRMFYNENLQISDADEFIKDVNPTPYNLGFELEIRTQSMSQFTQILENILPFFKPARHLRVKEFSFLNIERNLKLKNEGISQDFLIEQPEESRRHVNGTLQLMVEAFLYLPLSNENIIKEIRTRYYEGSSTQGLSAFGGFDTSAWDSSASFPTSAWDISGSYTYTTSGTSGFDYYKALGW